MGKILKLQMHGHIQLSDCGQVGPTLGNNTGIQPKITNMAFKELAEGVLVTGNSTTQHGLPLEFFVPFSMIMFIQYAPNS